MKQLLAVPLLLLPALASCGASGADPGAEVAHVAAPDPEVAATPDEDSDVALAPDVAGGAHDGPADSGSGPDASDDASDGALELSVVREPRQVPPPAKVPEPTRWVAIGDLHGDLAATREALRLAGAIDATDRWVGGDLVVVQVGDQLDRGDDEQAILDLLERLADDAHAAGGALYILLGNHETMNVDEDFRYVTAGGWRDFADTPHDPADPALARYAPDERGRVAAFRPGGPYARLLAGHNVAMQVGDTLFVHGGLLPQHRDEGLARINQAVSDWMRGDGPRPALITADDSPLWDRTYSEDPDAAACTLLVETLAAFRVKRMVVAHTVQDQGITSACEGQVWRVDVGLASHYGGTTQVLARSADGTLTVLR